MSSVNGIPPESAMYSNPHEALFEKGMEWVESGMNTGQLVTAAQEIGGVAINGKNLLNLERFAEDLHTGRVTINRIPPKRPDTEEYII